MENKNTVILMVEDFDSSIDYSCPYTSHVNSTQVLQVFNAGITSNAYAIIALNSPAGNLQFQVPQKEESRGFFKNILNIMDIDGTQNPNTLPILLVFNQSQYPELLRSHQMKQEEGKTPISYIHIAYGIILIILAIGVGIVSIDHDPLTKYQMRCKEDA